MADTLGIAVTALLVPVVVGLLFSMRYLVYRPLIALRAAIDRLRGVGPGPKASEGGVTELREIGRAFNSMSAALARQRESQLKFVSAVAHDLRNPLATLKTGAQLLSQGRVTDEAKKARTVELMLKQVSRLERMVGDLLDRSRIEAGQLELKPERHDLRDLVREAAELYQPTSQAHRIALKLAEEAAPCQCDPLRIEQVLGNLISNAIKYSPKGGTVEVGACRDGGEVAFWVKDEGYGIPSEECEAIFEPFHRAPATRGSVSGIGLGLSVSRKIVHAHGGRIEVESAPGNGATFRVRLPGAG